MFRLLVTRLLVTLLLCHSTNANLSSLKNIPKPTNHQEAFELFNKARSLGNRQRSRAGAISAIRSTQNKCILSSPPSSSSFRVTPIDFGADPTGKTDSTKAFTAALHSLLNHTSSLPQMASSIINHGGVILDLAGGVYTISQSVTIPVLVGNIQITGSGTLRASPTFPTDNYLIQIGSPSCVPTDGQKVCNEFITISDIFLDASHIAAGGIQVSKTMGTTITNSFMTAFNVAGVLIDQGHETMISKCWVAEYYWSDNHDQTKCVKGNTGLDGSGSTGIIINGEDNIVSDIIIFDFTCTGVWVNGAANLLQGVHSWNGAGVAISVNGSYDVQDRIVDCYLDYDVLEIVNPRFVLVQGNFFYNTHTELLGTQPVTQLVMRENIYSLNDYGGNKSVVIAKGATCNHVTVEDEINGYQGSDEKDAHVLQTHVKKSLHLQGTSTVLEFVFDFSKELIFGQIDFVQYTIVQDAGAHQCTQYSDVATKINDTAYKVLVSCSLFSGTVFMEVAECSL